ncbi:hypothetical protein KAW18_06305 [candidate division WOR-3 bacterium]|nr:hypothetical protein [candidate division WOR-3 bacterium]
MTTFRILPVIENRRLGPYTLLRIKDVGIHKYAGCGQFVMVGLSFLRDPFLLRPLSFLSVDNDSFSLLIKIKGRGTEMLSMVKPGEYLKVLGPLGRTILPGEKGILIAGGIGIAPLFYQSQWMRGGVLLYGAKDKRELVLVKEMEDRGLVVKTITEEKGGTVCDLVMENIALLKGQRVFICGPVAMIKSLREIIRDYTRETFVYLERRMGCGIGGCKSCAIKTGYGYKFVCQDGPVFPLEEVEIG